MVSELNPSQKAWRWRIFALTWLAYAGFYLCRKNLSVTMPLIAQQMEFSTLQLANVVFGYSLLYSLGQFGFGLLADRFGARLIVTAGLLLSVVANVLMGFFAGSLALLIVLACLNGTGQSAGWPGLVKNMAAWFRHKERGVVMAWWTTNYVVGGFVATIFGTFVVTSAWLLPGLGWRRGFWIPAAVLLLVAIPFVVLVRNRPADAEVADIPDTSDGSEPGLGNAGRGSTLGLYWRMLGDLEVWVVAIGALFSKVTRYSFLFWLPMYLSQKLHYKADEAGYTSSLFELAGFGGALVGGYVSDKLMQSRRLPIAALMMWGLAAVCWLHPHLASFGHGGVALSIALIGIMNYGPDTLMQGAATQDLGARWGVGAASGFVDGVSSVGQLISSYLVGYIAQKYGWDQLFYAFVGMALVGGLVMATRWNHSTRPVAAAQPITTPVTSESNLNPQ